MDLFPQLSLVADREEATKRTRISLTGKILSEKTFSSNEVFMIIRRIWFTKEIPKVEEVARNTFLFTFNSASDRNRVWHRRPWTINKSHLLLREWKPEGALQDICFNFTTFWVQIKAFPLQFMTKRNAEMIGSLFSKLLKYEDFTRTNIIGSKYLLIQVEIDVRKPIPVGFFHNMGQGGQWISFKFEKLPDLCYFCGILGHSRRTARRRRKQHTKFWGTSMAPGSEPKLKLPSSSETATCSGK